MDHGVGSRETFDLAGLAAEVNEIHVQDEQACLKSENEQLKLNNASLDTEVKLFKSVVCSPQCTKEQRPYWLCELH